MGNKAHNALDIARYTINYCNDKNISISNLKLQKILYYIQAAYLVKLNKCCFKEDIVHWDYGPVIKNVYDEFRQFGCDNIPTQTEVFNLEFDSKNFELNINNKFNNDFLDDADINLINEIINIYGKIEDPFILVEKTHKEDPWKNSEQNDVIETKNIKDYYNENKDKLYNL